MSDGPVFITGLADTGKTPLTRSLNARTSILVSRHTQLWRRSVDSSDHVGAPELEARLEALLRDPAVRRLHPDAEQLREALAAGGASTVSDILVQLHVQHAARNGKRRWGEQCRALATYADRLLGDLPSARVIHLVRDPVTSYRIVAGRAGNTPGRLGRFTARWRAAAELARWNAERFPERYLLVRYEALAARTDATVREICDFLDEPVDDAPFTWESGPSVHAPSERQRADDTLAPARRSRVSHADEAVRFVALHAAGPLGALGYAPGSPRRSANYLARWPANRLALAVTRGPTLASRPPRPGG